MNVHAQMDGDEGSWKERARSQIPKFFSTYFDMYFDTARVMYQPGREVEKTGMLKWYTEGPGMDNTVYSDMLRGTVTANKHAYEQTFLIEDSLRRLEWREKDELRMIAGFKCRKAVTRICDSVYVVAFYAEDIPVSGGPELFAGLPGMILELAVPRLHTTWTAIKIETTAPASDNFKKPTKGKKMTEGEMEKDVKENLARWGKYATRNYWWISL